MVSGDMGAQHGPERTSEHGIAVGCSAELQKAGFNWHINARLQNLLEGVFWASDDDLECLQLFHQKGTRNSADLKRIEMQIQNALMVLSTWCYDLAVFACAAVLTGRVSNTETSCIVRSSCDGAGLGFKWPIWSHDERKRGTCKLNS